jgi:hypothetical protein
LLPTAIVGNSKVEKEIYLYPNPTTDVLYFKYKNISEEDIREISIYNLNGRLLYQTMQYQQGVDVSDFANGTYLVRVRLKDAQFYKKIVLQ